MNKTKQATLFQSWGSKKPPGTSQASAAPSGSRDGSDAAGGPKKPWSSTITAASVIDLCDDFDDDDEDDLLLHAEDTFTAALQDTSNNSNNNNQPGDGGNQPDYACDISFGADDYTASQQRAAQDLPGFDPVAGKLWIYPTNYPVRNYQFNIVQQALFKNTMVTLPTGLGKTFIAAVVMYNFYRWYPRGKVVFMAPTKPLVAQQIEACYNIMGIPQQHTAEMTGTMMPPRRKISWQEKRVFFLTPQVLINDLSRGSCPGDEVRCLVIDEAHKALGNHAYCQVVRELIKHSESFRVLALSATPGSDIKAVQAVLGNLLIAHIEIRTEECLDIKPYCHERRVDKVVVPLGDELTHVKTKYLQVMEVIVKRLKQYGVLYHRDTASLSKFLILKAREGFRQDPPEKLQRAQFGMVEGDFAIAMSLYHGYELLQLHGSRSLHNFLQGILSGDKAYGRTRSELAKNQDFNDLMGMLAEKYKPATSESGEAVPMVVGHPKMMRLQDIVLEHFRTFKGGATRVMIFSQYRDSVQEIRDMLDAHRPMIKVMSFIGQASTSKTTKGFTQKEQLKVMAQFREGGYNTLVSTCVGEEGLDIGDVDLIVCFDAHKSPIRLVQRMGRTGRKREGRIVMLLTQGKEEQIYNQSQYSKRSIHKAILNGAKSLHFYGHNPRMIPAGFSPAVHKMHITVKDTFNKKINLEKGSEQKPVAHALADGSARKGGEELLTLQEYRELEPWLVPEAEIPRLAPGCFQSLPPKQATAASGVLLSLSEWSPWQTTLQETARLDHSMAARHLVELMGFIQLQQILLYLLRFLDHSVVARRLVEQMGFIQLQQSLDPDDDPYGLEMAAYLNEDDVVVDGRETEAGQSSMLKWCQPTAVQMKDANHNVKKGGKKKKQKVSKTARCSEALQVLDDGANSDRSSDNDLPAFDIGNKLPDHPDSHAGEPTTAPVDTVGKGKQLKRKRRHTSNQSVIDVLQDTDSADFDSVAANFQPGSTKKTKAIFPTTRTESRTVNSTKQDSKVDCCDNFVSTMKATDLVDDKVYCVPTRYTLSSIQSKLSTVKAKGVLHAAVYPVPPAPSTDNLAEILDGMDSLAVANINLVALVREWQLETTLGKFSAALDSDTDSHSDSSLEDFPVFTKHTNHNKSDSENLKTTDSPCRIAFDVNVSSDIDERIADMSPNTNIESHTEHEMIEKDSNHGMEASDDSMSEDMPPFDMCDVNAADIKDRTQGSVTLSPRRDQQLNDHDSSSSPESSPVFFKSQRRTTQDNTFTRLSKMHTSPVTSLRKDKLNKTSSKPSPDHEFELGKLQSHVQESELGKLQSHVQESELCTNVQSSDSWSCDGMDDSLFKAIKTPCVSGAQGANTQVTFTQAFDCLHSSGVGSDMDCSETGEKSLGGGDSATRKTMGEIRRSTTSDASQMEMYDENDDAVLSKSLKDIEQTGTKQKCNESEKSEENVEFVHKETSLTSLSGKDTSSNSNTTENTSLHSNTVRDACLNSNTMTDTSLNSSTTRNTSPNSTSGRNISSNSYSRENTSLSSNKHESFSSVNQNDISKKESMDDQSPAVSEDDVEFPDFNLGFDIDEGIIPPSPESQPARVSRLSQIFRSDVTERLANKRQEKQAMTALSEHEDSLSEEERSNCDSYMIEDIGSNCKTNVNENKRSSHGDMIEDNGPNCNTNVNEDVGLNCGTNVPQLSPSSSFRTKKKLFKDSKRSAIFDDSDDQALPDKDKNSTDSDVEEHTSRKTLDSTGNSALSVSIFQRASTSVADNEALVGCVGEAVETGEASPAGSTGYECLAANFDTSFSLLDDDLDEWIDTGANVPYVTAETKPQSDHETGTDKHDNTETDDAPEITNHSENLDSVGEKQTSKKDKDFSMYMKDVSSTLFEDSFNTPGSTSLKAVRSRSNNWLSSRSNTNTPLGSSGRNSTSTPLLGSRSKTTSTPLLTPKGNNTSTPLLTSGRSNTSTPLVTSGRKVQAVTPFRSFTATEDTHASDLDDSFVVRRPKKANKIESSGSESDELVLKRRSKESDKGSTKENKQLDSQVKKNRLVELASSSDDDDFDDSFLLTKNKYIVKKPDPLTTSISSDEFEEDIPCQNQRVPKSKTTIPSRKTHKTVKPNQKRPSNPFIEEEADLSEEGSEGASSDEGDGSDLDRYEDSFIADSQPSQAAMDQTDLHAIYLQSVVSPVHQRGGYKLSYNNRHVDVFSQAPRHDDEEASQYMEDSFCVGYEDESGGGSDDEMEWLGAGQEAGRAGHQGEVTLLGASSLHAARPRRRNTKTTFMTSRQRDIHAGRMKALDKIRAKAGNKKTAGGTEAVVEKTDVRRILPKKNRIQVLEESSEEEYGNQIEVSKLFSPAPKPAETAGKKRLRIMSSSSDEGNECESLPTNNASTSTDSSKDEISYNNDLMTRIKPRLKPAEGSNTTTSCDSTLKTTHKSGFLISDCKNSARTPKENVILVDSKELNGAQCIISELRFKHGVRVSAAQLSSCDYLVSDRMAVERQQWAEFSSGSNRTKLVERVQQLVRMYDKVCLIVEKDRVKPGEEPPKVTTWSKYVDKTIALLLRSPVRLLFSEDQTETAELLSELCQVEQRKELGITARTDLDPHKTSIVKFYTSLPQVTYINALNLCEGFSCIQEFMLSSVAMIEEKGKMSKSRAAAVYNYIRRRWDPAALSKGKT